jgi:hypothetical protein
MGHNTRAFNGTIFSIYVDVDLKNPKIYTVYLNRRDSAFPTGAARTAIRG